MSKLFLSIYRYFRSHKALMWIVMLVSAAVFAFYGLQMKYDEDISSLLPSSDVESQLAFSSIGLKDKIYIQVAPADGAELTTDELGELMDELCGMLAERDTATGYIANILSRIEVETALEALDFALEHLPSFVDGSAYAAFDEALKPENASHAMERGYQAMMADETGSATQMVTTDPLELRNAIVGDAMQSLASSYTIAAGHFFCPDSTVALAWLAPAFRSYDSQAARKFARQLDRTVADFEAQNPGVRVFVHGTPINSVSNSNRMRADLLLTVGISLLIILILMGMVFRSGDFLWRQLLPIVYGVFFALAVIYWVKGSMSFMALGTSVIVLGVAISYCLHVMIHHFFVGDVERLLADEAKPVFLGCATTVGAFCSLLFTESDLLRDFGMFSALALSGSTLFALVFLPHFLPKNKVGTESKAIRGIMRIGEMPVDRTPWFLVLMSVAVVVGMVFAPRVKFDSDLRNLNYKTPESIEAENLFNEKNNDGYTHLYYATVSTDLDEALEADLALMPTFDSLKQAGLVHSYNAIVPKLFISRREQERRIAAWNAYWTEERKAEAMRLVEQNAKRLGVDASVYQGFANLIETDYEPASLAESGVVPPELLANFIECNADSQYMVFTDVSMNMEDKDAVTKAAIANPGTFVLEPFYYCKSMVEVINDDFNVAVWISSLLVLIILLLSFRNIATALLSFLPMVVSWFVVQGYMAILGLEFNLINIVISTFIFGVGVDYSIFITEGLLAQARTGKSDMLAWHKVAILFSAVILVIVVASLLFAVHPAVRSIGLSTLIGMASTIIISYSLQPFLFRQMMKIPAYRRSVLKQKDTTRQ